MKLNLSKGLLLLLAIVCLYSCDKEQIEIDENETIVSTESSVKSSSFKHQLAQRWAPIHYQDVDASGSHSLNGKSDYITAINFDGDWNATNNWTNINYYSAKAHCYYSVVSTNTHWFIIYSFFHPRDWTNDYPFNYLDEHENDLEGMLMVIERNGSTYGNLKACITVAHLDFYSFTPSSSNYSNGKEDIDGTLEMRTYNNELHPVTAQECRGHGLKAYPKYKINGGDGVIYYPSMSDVAQAPSNNYDTFVSYKLVDIFEAGGLWDQRFNTALFKSSAGAFQSSHGSGGANAPWKWDDRNDDFQAGALAKDPAGIVNNYFYNKGSFSLTYTDNPY